MSMAEDRARLIALAEEMATEASAPAKQAQDKVGEVQSIFTQVVGDPMLNSHTQSASQALAMCMEKTDELVQVIGVAADAITACAMSNSH